jgi:hypothetical protein
MLNNPLRRFFRKPALTRAADDYRNNGHVLARRLQSPIACLGESHNSISKPRSWIGSCACSCSAGSNLAQFVMTEAGVHG